jgi:uncharacterized membrane protein
VKSGVRRYALALLLLYPLLAIAGAVTQRQIFPLAALVLLLTLAMLPRLLARRPGAWLAWAGLVAGLLMLSAYGFAALVLEAVPVLVSALLACWFGRSLGTAEPLVARFVVALEGADRLQQPGVSRYARQLTWFWTLLLGSQAVLLATLLLCAKHGGVLARLGMATPLPVPDRWAAAALHAGGYMLLAAVFVLEYGYRRWRLRHLRHPGLGEMLMQLALRWPQLVHGGGAAS